MNYVRKLPHECINTQTHIHTEKRCKQSPRSQWDAVSHAMCPVTLANIISSTYVSRGGTSEAIVSIVKVPIASSKHTDCYMFTLCVCVCVCVWRRWGRSWRAMCIIQAWIDIWRKIAAGLINANVLPWDAALCVFVCACMYVCARVCVCLSGEVSSRHQQHFSPVSSDLASLCTTRLMNRSVHCVCVCVCVCLSVCLPVCVCVCIVLCVSLVWKPSVLFYQTSGDITATVSISGVGCMWVWTWQPPCACSEDCAVSRAPLCSRGSTQHDTLKVK